MKLTILGSGTLVPIPKRGNSGYFLQTENQTVLIDGGSGTLRRIADLGLNYQDIDIICYTHLHPDHTFDLVPLLFAFKYDPDVNKPRKLQIIAPRGFQSYYNRLMELYGDWVLPDDVTIAIQEVFRDTLEPNGLKITCGHTEHTDHSVTFRFEEKNGKSLFYSGDTDVCDELTKNAQNVDVLILECSFPDDKKIPGHLTPTECGKIAAEAQCKRLVLTHFYPEVLKTDIKKSVLRYYKGKVELAYDGMQIVV